MGTPTTLRVCVLWIGTVWVSVALAANAPAPQKGAEVKRPNIVFICTDQQRIDAMSCAGNGYLKTPGLDGLAARGVRFTKSYCTQALCSPSRASLMTSRMSYEVGVTRNSVRLPKGQPTLGTVFKAAGYHTVWSGKWHLPTAYPAAEAQEVTGFEVITPQGVSVAMRQAKGKVDGRASDADPGTTDAAVLFLRERPKQPFLLVVSLLNPHDICSFGERSGAGLKVPTDVAKLPPLPANLKAHDTGSLGDKVPGKKNLSPEYGLEWSELAWRQQLYQYYRLTEQADRSIQAIEEELRRTGLGKSTVVLLTSDHGEMAGSHRRIRKHSLYEEAMAVPFIVAGPGIRSKVVETNYLVSGLDVLPTLCELAGIKPPAEVRGLSLAKVLKTGAGPSREAVFGALGPGWSRMVRTEQYKYMVNRWKREELFDLKADPGETKNLAEDPGKKVVLERHRKLLKEWREKTKDSFGKSEGESAGGEQ